MAVLLMLLSTLLLAFLCEIGNAQTPNLCNHSSPKNWTLVWEDTFSGKDINASNWNVAHNFTHGDQELQLYMADDAYVEDGNLVLRTRKNPTMHGKKLYNWTSAWVDTRSKVFHLYGRFEIRAKLPNPKSWKIWPAHWLMPEPTTSHPPNICWPTGGEVDILESYGMEYNDTAQGTYHWGVECGKNLRAGPNGWYPDVKHGAKDIDFSQDYHIFAVEWDKDCLKWFVDDNYYWHRYTNDEPAPHGAIIPSMPLYVILNTAISWWDADNGRGHRVSPGEAAFGPNSNLHHNSNDSNNNHRHQFDEGFDPLMPVYHYIDHVRIYTPAP